jgi:hypothetical protein
MILADAGTPQVPNTLYINMVFTPIGNLNEVKAQDCYNVEPDIYEPYVAIEVSGWGNGGVSDGNGVYIYKDTEWNNDLDSNLTYNGTLFNLNFNSAITVNTNPQPSCAAISSNPYASPIFAATRQAAQDLLESICYTCPSQGGGNQFGNANMANQSDSGIDFGTIKFQIT